MGSCASTFTNVLALHFKVARLDFLGEIQRLNKFYESVWKYFETKF